MKGIGIVIDALAIILGGSFGLMLKYELPTWIKRLVLQVLGLAAILFGAYSLIDGWFAGDAIAAEIEESFLIVVSLILGLLFGEALRLDRALDRLGASLRKIDRRSEINTKGKKAAANEREMKSFADGFATATMLCALSTMTFTATLTECLDGNQKAMLIKAAVDAIVIFILTQIYGAGASFAVVPTLIVESILAIVATQRTAWLTPTYMGHLTIISSVILIGTGINLAFGKRLRVINLLPAFFIGPFYWWAIKSVKK